MQSTGIMIATFNKKEILVKEKGAINLLDFWQVSVVNRALLS